MTDGEVEETKEVVPEIAMPTLKMNTFGAQGVNTVLYTY